MSSVPLTTLSLSEGGRGIAKTKGSWPERKAELGWHRSGRPAQSSVPISLLPGTPLLGQPAQRNCQAYLSPQAPAFDSSSGSRPPPKIKWFLPPPTNPFYLSTTLSLPDLLPVITGERRVGRFFSFFWFSHFQVQMIWFKIFQIYNGVKATHIW